jgi:hypothetical protein
MKKLIKTIKFWFKKEFCFLSINECKSLNLEHSHNVWKGCTSIWRDKKGKSYRCENLYIFIICMVCLFSCKTSEQLYTKAKVKDIVKVAELARIDFPCTTTKIDSVTTVDTLYDFIEVDCPPATVDTFKTVVVNTVKVKVPHQLTTIRTLLKIEDSAKIKVMYSEIQKAAAIIANERKVSATYKMQSEDNLKQRNWWRKWCLITWGVIAVGIAFRLFRSKIGL